VSVAACCSPCCVSVTEWQCVSFVAVANQLFLRLQFSNQAVFLGLFYPLLCFTSLMCGTQSLTHKPHHCMCRCWSGTGLDRRVLSMLESLVSTSLDLSKLKIYFTGERTQLADPMSLCR
jgi:hypothetical protein